MNRENSNTRRKVYIPWCEFTPRFCLPALYMDVFCTFTLHNREAWKFRGSALCGWEYRLLVKGLSWSDNGWQGEGGSTFPWQLVSIRNLPLVLWQPPRYLSIWGPIVPPLFSCSLSMAQTHTPCRSVFIRHGWRRKPGEEDNAMCWSYPSEECDQEASGLPDHLHLPIDPHLPLKLNQKQRSWSWYNHSGGKSLRFRRFFHWADSSGWHKSQRGRCGAHYHVITMPLRSRLVSLILRTSTRWLHIQSDKAITGNKSMWGHQSRQMRPRFMCGATAGSGCSSAKRRAALLIGVPTLSHSSPGDSCRAMGEVHDRFI